MRMKYCEYPFMNVCVAILEVTSGNEELCY